MRYRNTKYYTNGGIKKSTIRKYPQKEKKVSYEPNVVALSLRGTRQKLKKKVCHLDGIPPSPRGDLVHTNSSSIYHQPVNNIDNIETGFGTDYSDGWYNPPFDNDEDYEIEDILMDDDCEEFEL